MLDAGLFGRKMPTYAELAAGSLGPQSVLPGQDEKRRLLELEIVWLTILKEDKSSNGSRDHFSRFELNVTSKKSFSGFRL